jgi:hypothetical protein
VVWALDEQLLQLSDVPERGNVGVPITLEATALPGNDPVSVDFRLDEQYPRGPFPGEIMPLPVSGPRFFLFDEIRIGPIILPPYQPNLGNLGTILGTAHAAPWQLTWTPAGPPGPYKLWARSTNALGEVHETLKAKIVIYEANDDFVHPTEIDPSATSASFPYGTYWSSAETNEPPHRFGPPSHSLWWKWTPARSGNVRFKATRFDVGMSLEVFTGNDLSNLRPVAGNQNTMFRRGYSGAVRLQVKARQTYYIRVDEDPRGPGAPAGPVPTGVTPADSVLAIEPASTPLPGQVNFSLIAGGFMGRNGPVILPFGRVFQPDNQTPLVGFRYRAQLYVGRTPTDLSPVGPPSPFFGDEPYSFNPSYAGLFYPQTVQLPYIRSGQRVYAQIRVWDYNYGTSFENAWVNGGPTGVSMVVKVIAGSEETGPAPLMGMRSFSLRRPNP